jgi:hypothetical protein
MNGRAKAILTLDRNLPAQLFRPRRISSTAEIDHRFFPNGRIPLLLSATTTITPRRLADAGVECDDEGAFVRQAAPINFEILDSVLPFAARQTITPVLGDLIPGSSWGSNLHNLLTRHSWEELRRRAFLKTGFRCETCGTAANLECHELWEYHEHCRNKLPRRLAAFSGLCG